MNKFPNLQLTTYNLQLFLVVSCWLLVVSSPVLALSGTTFDPSRTLFTARQLGMGGLSVAYSDDANGVFSNPAGLSNVKFPQLSGTSRKLFLEEVNYSLADWAIPTSWGTFGLGYVGMGTSGSIQTYRDPGTTRIIQNPSLEVMGYDNSVMALSYSKEFSLPFKLPNQKISLGGNLKFFNQGLSGGVSDKGSGTSLDLGLLYKPSPWLTTGAVLQNVLGGSLKWSNSEDTLGGYYKLGIAAQILGSSQEALRAFPQKLSAGLDISLPNKVLSQSSSMLYQLGLEYSPLKNIAVRGGLNQEGGFTLGLGFTNTGFRFDYAYVQRPAIPGDTPHYFTFSYVGDRIVSVHKKLKKKESAVTFFGPKDRSITSQDVITVSGEVKVKRVLDQKTTWTVPSISATHEVQEVYELEEVILPTLAGRPIPIGSFETQVPLQPGRNVISLVGYTTPEAQMISGEVKVLRFIPFEDTPMDYWAIEPIALISTLDIIKGYPDKTFRPEKGITRAELITLLVKTRGVSSEDSLKTSKEQVFKDVPADHWAASHVSVGSKLGLIQGYPDGTFKPNKVLNRAEGVTIFARFSSVSEEAYFSFKDIPEKFWAAKYIYPAKKMGLLKYLEDKNFEPSRKFTRAEATEVLYRTPAIQKMVNQWWETSIVSAPQAAPITKPTTFEAQPEKPATSEAQ